MPGPIVVVGSVNTDFVLQTPRLPQPGETVTDAHFEIFGGGKGANQAVAAAQLGAPTVFVGKVGDDAFGGRLRQQMRAAGVNVTQLGSEPRTRSGVAFVLVDRAGRNTIVVSPGANRRLSVTDIRRARPVLARAAAILVQLEIPLPTVAFVLRTARRGVPVILDAAPARPLPRRLLARVTILTANEVEAAVLGGVSPRPLTLRRARSLCRRLLALGPRVVILKLGERGAMVGEANGTVTRVPAFRVRVVDTTAAGDAFNGGLAVALREGKSLLEAVQFASAAAALSVTRLGAQLSLPTRAELRRWFRKRQLSGW